MLEMYMLTGTCNRNKDENEKSDKVRRRLTLIISVFLHKYNKHRKGEKEEGTEMNLGEHRVLVCCQVYRA